MVFFFFFFSSRRRHTRWTGDWSSDVCSSDLFVVRKPIRAPKLALLPVTATPRKGLFLSTLLHSAIAAMLMSVPILFPAWLVSVPSAAAGLDREVDYQPLLLPLLPSMAEASAGAKIEYSSGQ